MARMKKDAVIEALKAIEGLEFDENGKYNYLCKLLKEKTTPTAPDGTKEVISGKNSITIPRDLYDRCRKFGLSDAQIARYPDAEALKRSANGMHPKSDPDARIKQGKVPEPPKFEQMMKDVFTLESILEAKFIKSNREHFDRNSLNTFLCNIRRRYGPQEPVRIVKDQSNIVVKRELVTTFTIYYK